MNKTVQVTIMFVMGAALGAALLFVAPSTLVAQEATNEEISEERAQLEKQLRVLEEEIARHRANVEERSIEARTLEGDIAVFNSEIYAIELQIQAASIALQSADVELAETQARIVAIGEAVERQREQIGALLRRLNDSDSISMFEILLRDETLSDFFTAIDSLQIMQGALQGSLAEVRALRLELEQREVQLEETIEEQGQILGVQEFQQQQIAVKRNEIRHLLDETRGEEKLFQNILTRTERSAGAIRGQLFILEGGGSGPLTFEQAYEFAQEAAVLTGIRPAFLMSIIKQESNFGANVGQCFWRQGVGGKSVMHPTRDQPAFAEITGSLGIDPDTQPISCPGSRILNGVRARYGWGGAMGPAQFIPSTWMGYKDDVAELTGRLPANPWLPGDAFTASALKLVRGGAGTQTYDGEFVAAMRYFSGGRWSAWEESVYAIPILNRAVQIERDIAILEAN